MSVVAQTLPSSKLEVDVQQLRYADLASDLASTPAGPEHDLFEGLLDNRINRVDTSVALLTPLSTAANITPARMALILAALADDHIKLFHYAEAHRLYDRLFAEYSAQLTPEALRDDGDDNATVALLLDTPAQTITQHDIVDLPTHPDPLGSFATTLTAHGATADWILDTGANFSVLSESYARQLGLTLSTGTAQTLGATGAENSLHTATLDTLELGGATLHNVVFLVLPDANLTIPLGKKKRYVIPAILGYPPFAALGTIRFTQDHHFLAGPDLAVTGASSPIYMDKLSPLIAPQSHRKEHVFLFDSGANQSSFNAIYHQDFPLDFLHLKQGKSNGYGAGGGSIQNVAILEDVSLVLAGRNVTLHKVPVSLQPAHLLSDRYEGSIGRDLLDDFSSITLDFTHARFYLGAPVSATEK